jgi:ABC-type cobalamin/Fe3+-siderophores transport system ATPase subunit
MNIFDSFRDIELTIDQHKALDSIENFLNGSQDVFILNGYAGSGKTTLLKGLTK